jgi:sugar transferase EpsL
MNKPALGYQGKRLFDILLSGLALLLLSPLLALLALAVLLTMGYPAIFRQMRPGLNGKPFAIYKFRTMRDEFDAEGKSLPDGQRLTRFGRFLRKTSLDELPELFNILKGEMSLVGPRPLLMRYYPYYTETEQLRHTVRPGVTGWAQIHGRNMLDWDSRLALDVWYVQNMNFLLDMRIIFGTFMKIFRADGIVVDPASVMLNLDEERAGKVDKGNELAG